MTISSTTSRASYAGTGSTGPFAFPFKITNASDLLVTRKTAAGAETTLVLGVDYTVSGVNNATGSITLVTALTGGGTPDILTIRRAPALTQTTSIRNQGPYFPGTHEDQFDRTVMQLQSLQDQIDRCLKLSEAFNPATNVVALRENTAGKAIVGNGAGFSLATLDSSAVALPGAARTVTTLSQYLANNSVYNIEDYGGDGTRVLSSSNALNNAMAAASAAGGGVVSCPRKYRLTASHAQPANVVIVGQSRVTSELYRDHAADMWTSIGDRSGMTNIKLTGNSATYGAGKGIANVAAGSTNQVFLNVEITDFPNQCLQFGPDGGSGFTSLGCLYFTTAAPGVAAAIKVNGTDSAACPRFFLGTMSNGCTLFDFGGANDFFAFGGYSNGLIFSLTGSAHIMLGGFRIGAAGGTVTIKGASHTFGNCVFAAPVILDVSATGVDLMTSEVPAWNITDNGTNNRFRATLSPVPVWTGSTTNPTIGNGTLESTVLRVDRWVEAEIRIVIGTTTTLGTGAQWFISVPFKDYTFGRYTGTVKILDASTGKYYTAGVAYIEPGQQKIGVYFDAAVTFPGGAGTALGPAFPLGGAALWAVGDEVIINIGYMAL